MHRTRPLLAGAFIVLATTSLGLAVHAQDAPKPGGDAGCTTANGVSTGAGCKQGAGSPAGAVENGMPVTEHQKEVMKTDDKATSGQNMDATGAGGSALPETEHQEDVLKKPDAGTDKGTAPQQ